MTLEELTQALEDIGYPVFYSHPIVDDNNPAPDLPYITYLFAYSNDFMADNINYVDVGVFQIELYTKYKDLDAEQYVQNKLKELRLPYNKTETYLDTEKLYQIIYEIQLIGG